MSCAVEWNVLGKQKNDRREKSFGCIIEERILSAVLLIAARIDDGFGEDLRVFFRLRPRRKVVRMLPRDVHVSVDERQQIAPV